MKSLSFRFVRSTLAAAAAGALMWATPSFAQNTIKIGMITDKVGAAKAYAEPVAAGASRAATAVELPPDEPPGAKAALPPS